MPPSYSPCPRPILKRNSASLSDPEPRDESTQLLAIDPSILSSLVHFPPSPILASTLGSAPTYDRSPIVVSPNRCTLPARGCPGRTYSLDDPLPTRQQSPPRTGRTVHPRALHNEPRSWPTARAEPLSLPALIPDLSSESSEESDGFISAAPECLAPVLSVPHAKRERVALPSGPALAFLPHPPASRNAHTRPHSPARARSPCASPTRSAHSRRRSRARTGNGRCTSPEQDREGEMDSALGSARYKAFSEQSVLHECSLTVPDLGCLGGF